MSETTKIQWTDSTGGPWLGCTRISPGCKNCYASALAETRLEPIFRKAYKAAGFADWATMPVWGDKAPRVLTKGFWDDAVRLNAKAGKEGVRRKIFPSQIDIFDACPAGIIDQDGNRLDSIEVLARFLKLVHDTPNLTWLLLTKRPENWEPRLRDVRDWGHQPKGEKSNNGVAAGFASWWLNGNAPENVWLGVSCENQEQADKRIPLLTAITAKVRFISAEPLLGPVDLEYAMFNGADSFGSNTGIHWVILGGESGPGARPCRVEWIRDVMQDCRKLGIRVFCKQLGSVWAAANKCSDKKGGTPEEWPHDLRVREFPEVR
jgi:protein gp37